MPKLLFFEEEVLAASELFHHSPIHVLIMRIRSQIMFIIARF